MFESEREQFENAIAADPYNETIHKAFSDWLEENGFDDEALWQRSWTKERQDAEQVVRSYAEEYDYTYDELIDRAKKYLETGQTEECRDNYIPWAADEFRDTFWGLIQLATGMEVTPEQQQQPFMEGCCQGDRGGDWIDWDEGEATEDDPLIKSVKPCPECKRGWKPNDQGVLVRCKNCTGGQIIELNL